MIVRRISNDELYHHGIEGQKWGVRRFQNEDGTLTPEGKRRYGSNKKLLSNYYYGAGSKVLKQKDKGQISNPVRKLADDLANSKEFNEYVNEKEKHVIKRYFNPQTGNIIKMYDGKKPTKIEMQKRQTLVNKGSQELNKILPKISDATLDAWGIEKTDMARKYVSEILKEDIMRAYFRDF